MKKPEKVVPGTDGGKTISRRGLLAGAGKIIAGIAGVTVASRGEIGLLSEAKAIAPAFPWGFKKVDPQRAGDIAYRRWYRGYCCYGTASGILLPLQEEIGDPYTRFPLEAAIWGHGGAVGWGALCGSLTGAGIATALVAGEEGEHILNDVIAWYTKTKLPIYMPSSPRAEVRQVNKSYSALCHISVGKWMRKEGVSIHSPRRWERCARVTADVAMKTVSLLNDWVEGKYVVTRRFPIDMYQMPTDNNCRECHGNNTPKVPEHT